MMGDARLHTDLITDDFKKIVKGDEHQLPSQDKIAVGYFVVLPDAIDGQGVVLFADGKGISAVDLSGKNF